jgi:hypothetical protein
VVNWDAVAERYAAAIGRTASTRSG